MWGIARGNHAAVVKTEGGVVPHLIAEEHVVVEVSELWGERAKIFLSGCLYYLIQCHHILVIVHNV
jgi:hypothetical protein